jgi:hypothetical protein
MPKGKCTNLDLNGKSCPKRGQTQTISQSKPFVCGICKADLTPVDAVAASPTLAIPKPATVWSFDDAQKWAVSATPVYGAPKANLKTFELPGTTSSTIALDLESAQVSLRVFTRTSAPPANRDMMVLVCHGRQIQPARTSGRGSGVRGFSLLVPIGTTLIREFLGTDGASQAAAKFASAPLAFATASIPMVYVGHHSEHELENSVVVGLHRVLPVCDVAIIVDSSIKQSADHDFQDDEKLPLHELLVGTELGNTYRNVLMMCCRSPWPRPLLGVSPGATGHIYSFNDDFRTIAE